MESEPISGVDRSSGRPKSSAHQKLVNFCTFVYNHEAGTVLGRNAKSWGQITFFYLIFYICLAGFFSAMMAVFYQILDDKYPRLTGSDSLLKGNPGLGFRPMPDVKTTLIRFDRADATTFSIYTDHIESYLQYYAKDDALLKDNVLVDCTQVNGRRDEDEADKACRFNKVELGTKCDKNSHYGFQDGQPCILLKMNRLYDWIPEGYSNKTVPEFIRHDWSEYSVTVTCQGENPSDTDNIGDVVYYPKNGFHFKYFPYRNQEGYRSPLVFVKFESPRKGVLIMVTCKIHARNIEHDFLEKAGSVHFELLVD